MSRLEDKPVKGFGTLGKPFLNLIVSNPATPGKVRDTLVTVTCKQ